MEPCDATTSRAEPDWLFRYSFPHGLTYGTPQAIDLCFRRVANERGQMTIGVDIGLRRRNNQRRIAAQVREYHHTIVGV